MAKLAILIDPNKGDATDRVFHALKAILTEYDDPSKLPLEIWVGDSSEIYRGVHNYLKKLHQLKINLPPVVIFPGHPLQISPLADYIQMPTLLNTYRFRIKVVLKLGKKYHWLSKWGRRIIGKHWPVDRKYGYMVLGPHSSVGKKLRAKDLTDELAYKEITKKWRKYWSMIYLEAGSGRFNASIADRLDLISKVKQFTHKKNALLITGGGIRMKEQVENLVKAGSDLIVVSTVLELSENPKALMEEFLKVVRI